MSYVIDTSVISMLHRNYYRKQFPTLWKLFDAMVGEGRLTSCREASRELEDLGGAGYDWAKAHPDLFSVPDAKDGAIVTRIYAVKHFQANIEKQKIYKGGLCADPFSYRACALHQSHCVDYGADETQRCQDPKYLQTFRCPMR